MRLIRPLQILFFIFILQLYACHPSSVPRTNPHTLIVLQLDTTGFYKHPGESNLANIRFLAKKTAVVLRQRLIKMGIEDNNMEFKDTNNLITFKLWQPEADSVDLSRIRKIVQSTFNLGFWETYKAKRVFAFLFEPGNTYEYDSLKSIQSQLFRLLRIQFTIDQNRITREIPENQAALGSAYANDTSQINTLLRKFILPRDMHFLWGKKQKESSDLIELYVAKGTEPALYNPSFLDVHSGPGNEGSGSYEIAFKMDESGALKWKRLTGANLEQFIAMTIDNQVYFCPIVKNEIPNGRCTISGSFTKSEASDFAALLSAGGLPAPLHIVEEKIEK